MARGKRARDEESTEEKNGQDLYKVLGVESSATALEIKKAYHKMALKLHPDKNPDDEGAKEKFQTLQKVYKVLGNPEKREVYDRTGSVEESELSGEKFNDLYDYYRNIFCKVTEADIETFEQSYRGSEEEAADLKGYYKQYKGNMDMVFNWLMCSEPARDSHRLKDILDAAIDSGELKSFPKYRRWAEKVAEMPASGLEKPKASKKKKGPAGAPQEDSLMALINAKQEERSSGLFASLEARYGLKGKKGKKVVAVEPTDEEFEAARARLSRRNGK